MDTGKFSLQNNNDNQNPNGDIKIEFTGLRPGEKLYEELLIDGEARPTEHPLIFKGIEKSISPEKLWKKLEILELNVKSNNSKKSLEILSELVTEWKRF